MFSHRSSFSIFDICLATMKSTSMIETLKNSSNVRFALTTKLEDLVDRSVQLSRFSFVAKFKRTRTKTSKIAQKTKREKKKRDNDQCAD